MQVPSQKWRWTVRNGRGSRLWLTALLAVSFTSLPVSLLAQSNKPNILVIFGDDIGQANLSRYTHGVVGYMTPNIDRVGEEGMTFTDYYAENSCTAGRSSFITGQSPIRTGLTKVGAPGAPVGLQKRDITIAQALKPLGYATGSSGKIASVTVTNICQPIMASTSSLAISIT